MPSPAWQIGPSPPLLRPVERSPVIVDNDRMVQRDPDSNDVVDIDTALDPQSWRRKDALWFEMTETFDSAAADDSYFGLDREDLHRVAQNFNDNDRISNTMKYELTEDFGACDQIWDDNEFGFSDEQLEVLWKRFGARLGDHIADSIADCDSNNASAPGFSTPARQTLRTNDDSQKLPCAQALETIEGSVDNIGTEQLSSIIGDGTLEQFIGGTSTLEQFIGGVVPPLPRPVMRAFLLSTNKFDGEDWYLFKVIDSGQNRFYMKAYSDFEELHEELEKRPQENGRPCNLPQLGGRDWWGIRRYFGGQDFESYRTGVLKEYLKELMIRPLAPCQEQVIRLFFGPSARGRIMPPKGPLFRAGKSYGF